MLNEGTMWANTSAYFTNIVVSSGPRKHFLCSNEHFLLYKTQYKAKSILVFFNPPPKKPQMAVCLK